MENPYLEVFNAALPEDGEVEKLASLWKNRTEWVEEYSWAIPNDKAISLIASLSPIIEIGAGAGYWAWLLRSQGVEVAAFDTHRGKWWIPYNRRWTKVRKGGPEKISRHPKHTLFLCWPYMDSMAYRCVKDYEGSHVVFVGEGWGGCTADDRFFEFMNEHFDVIEEVDIPHYPAVHDYLILYRRKRGPK